MQDPRTPEQQGMFNELASLIMTSEEFVALDIEMEEVRYTQPRVFGQVAQSVRQCIVAAIRKGYSAVGGRETVGGMRDDLMRHGLMKVSEPGKFDVVINETYDAAYRMGVATERAKRDTETDWLVDLYKALREVRTLYAIFVKPQQVEASDGD